MDIRDYCAGELETLWDESRRLVNPQEVYVDLSKPLWELKNELLDHVHNFEDNETKHAYRVSLVITAVTKRTCKHVRLARCFA